MSDTNLMVFSGNANLPLSEGIVKKLNMRLGMATLGRFSDGEIAFEVEENVRGKEIFVIQPTCSPTNENLMELLVMIDALKRASAAKITAVIPYYGYARQDRRSRSARVSISAKLVAKMIDQAGANSVLTIDLHADQIQGFFDIPVDHLYASSIFLPYIQSLDLPNLTIAAPDMGGSKRANAYAKHLKAEIVICYKQRTKANIVDHMTAIGEIEGRNIVLLDDLVDTGGTLCKAADMMMERGALSVRAVCSHALLSGKAYENIANSKLTELIVTDTVPLKQQCEKIKVLTVADLFAKVIHSVQHYESISGNFIM